MTEPVSARAESDTIRVLVVDDEVDQRHLLRTHLERAGCVVVEAASAEEALTLTASRIVDLAIVDLMLPGMDGWALADLLRFRLPDCPIAITSILDPAQYPAYDAQLPKPFAGAQVRELLERLVPRWSAS